MPKLSGKNIILGLLFLGLSIFYSIIFLQHIDFSQTTIFNLVHLKSLGNVFTSPINFDYWNHSGSQINLFSPWLSLLPGWLLVSLNTYFGFIVYFGLITFLTLLSAYFYMNKFANNTFEALFFAVFYTFSIGRFNLIFHQQRIENYLVLIFLPMVYYGVNLFFKNQRWQTLTWGCGLTFLTAPYMAIVVVLTILPIYFLVLFKKSTHSWKYWRKLALNSLIVLGMSVLISVGFVGPMLQVQLSRPLVQTPIKNIDYQQWFQQLNLPAVQVYLLIGIAFLLLLVVIVTFLKSRFSYKVMILEMIPLTVISLIKLPKFDLDYSRLIFSAQIILELFLIILICRIVILVFQEFPSLIKLILMVVTIGAMIFLTINQAAQIHPQTNLTAAQNFDYQKFVVNYHDQAANGRNIVLVDHEPVKVSYHTKPNNYWLQYYGTGTSILDLPIQNYDAFNVQLNNEAVKVFKSARQTVSLKTQPNKNIIEIQSGYNVVGIVSLLISLLGFLGLSYCSWPKSRSFSKKSPKKS